MPSLTSSQNMSGLAFYLHADTVLSWDCTVCLSIWFSSCVLSEDVRSTGPVLGTNTVYHGTSKRADEVFQNIAWWLCRRQTRSRKTNSQQMYRP